METIKRKRVMFPWITNPTGQVFKCYISILGDKVKWNKYWKNGKPDFKMVFNKKIWPKIKSVFPNMYTIVRNHYVKHGRTLTKKEFKQLCFMRFKFLYKAEPLKEHVAISTEHPKHPKEKRLKQAYTQAMKMYEE